MTDKEQQIEELEKCLLTPEEIDVIVSEWEDAYTKGEATEDYKTLISRKTVDKAIPIIRKAVEEENELRFNPDYVPDVKAILDEFNEARSHWQEETDAKVRAIAEDIKRELENKFHDISSSAVIISNKEWQSHWGGIG